MYSLNFLIMKKKITVIIGPTASGKSTLAIEHAKNHGADIISADAFQVYKEFDIGTGKLAIDERDGIRHHLIDHISPMMAYSVQQFLNDVADLGHHFTQYYYLWGLCHVFKALLYGYQPLKRLPTMTAHVDP